MFQFLHSVRKLFGSHTASHHAKRKDLRRFRPSCECLEDRMVLTTWSVTSFQDQGTGSLRAAIQAANGNPGLFDQIRFNLPGVAPYTIQLKSPLPTVTDGVAIDGWTQPGFTTQPLVVLDGSQAGPNAAGLVLSGGGIKVRGLIVNGFSGSGVVVNGNSDSITGCYIGTDATGSVAKPNTGDGVLIQNGAQNAMVGIDVSDTAERNIISGNLTNGVELFGALTNYNRVSGNYIGTDVTGLHVLGNGFCGVRLVGSPQYNRIGTTGNLWSDAGQRNVISGNGQGGVQLYGTGVSYNVVAGNYIGTDATGTKAIANPAFGVSITQGAQHNRIGVDGKDVKPLSEINLISGNLYSGLGIDGDGTNYNWVAGNYIGTDVTGAKPLGNGNAGVSISAALNQIGTDGDGLGDNWERNIISGNLGGNNSAGVDLSDTGSHDNQVSGNYIGTDWTGKNALPNGSNGVAVHNGAHNNRIGVNPMDANPSGEANVISGNKLDGVNIKDTGTDHNLVVGNRIGTKMDGSTALMNLGNGVNILGGAQYTLVGGSVSFANVIAFNGGSGVAVDGMTTSFNTIRMNSIFSNGVQGISLSNSANQKQKAPVFTSANATTISGYVMGTAFASYTIDLYVSTGLDAQGHGEGKLWLRSVTVIADALGKASFTLSIQGAFAGQLLTTTATDANGDTSVFSNPFTVA